MSPSFAQYRECCVVGRWLDSCSPEQWWGANINASANRSASAWGREHSLTWLLTCSLVCVLGGQARWHGWYSAQQTPMWHPDAQLWTHRSWGQFPAPVTLEFGAPLHYKSHLWLKMKILSWSFILFWLWFFGEILTKQTITASISASLMAANEVLLRARVLSLGGSPALQVPLALPLGEASAKHQPPSCHVDNGCLR